ncbi:MAG: 1-deoxy-D-xylulose-5-phosphate reductoisomerase, partial [Actinomycetota bacterium]
MRRVIILGSTGSIGTQAIEVINQNPEEFRVVGLAAGRNLELLEAQRQHFGLSASQAVLGAEAAQKLVEDTDADVVLNGITGSIGLAPTLATLRTGKTLALANKESLIVGGELVTSIAKPGQIVPVDSEHSAIAQCLRSGTQAEVKKLVLT